MKKKITDITFSKDEIGFERARNHEYYYHSYVATPLRIWRILRITGEWVRWEKYAKISADLYESNYGYRPAGSE